MNRQQLAEDRRQSGHHAHTRSHAQNASGQPQAQRLQQKYPQQIAGTCAHGLQNGQHVHALLQVSVHGHGHANRSQHHGNQADQAQNRGRVVQAPIQPRIALFEVHHLRVGQRRLHLLAQGDGIGLRRQLHQQLLAGPAARRQQAGALERRLRDHHPRSQSRSGAEAVRLLLQHGGNAEVPAAQPQRLADPRIQPNEKLLGHHRRITVESLLQAHRRLQLRRAVVGILGWVHGLERDQQRHRVGRR